MFCFNCGAQISDDACFCHNCGTAVAREPAKEDAIVTPDENPGETQLLPQQEETECLLQMQAPAQLEAMPEPESEAVQEMEPETVPQTEPETVPQTEPETVPQTEPEAVQETDAPNPVVVAEPIYQEPVEQEVQKKPSVAAKRKPHIVIRVLMQFLSLLLCLVLTACLVATVLLADLNTVTSEVGMQKLFSSILNAAPAPRHNSAVIGASGVSADTDVQSIIDAVLTDADNLQSVEALVDAVYEELEKLDNVDLEFSEEELLSFVQKSTVSDYVAGKLSGFAQDFINDTNNTVITAEELHRLIDENLTLLEQELNVVVDAKTRRELVDALDEMVNEQDLNAVIQEQVFVSVEEAINSAVSDTGMTWAEIQPIAQIICADLTLYIAIAICVLLMGMMCVLNFYNVPAGLTWNAIPCIVLGAVLTLIPYLLALDKVIAGIVRPFMAVLLPIHLGLLIFGLALLVIGIIWRIVRNIVRKKRAAQYA